MMHHSEIEEVEPFFICRPYHLHSVCNKFPPMHICHFYGDRELLTAMAVVFSILFSNTSTHSEGHDKWLDLKRRMEVNQFLVLKMT